MRIVLIVLVGLPLLTSNPGICQVTTKQDVYKKIVTDFYNCVLNKEFVSLRDYYLFFGQHAEDEDFLFFRNCDKTRSKAECDQLAREQFSSWSSHRSLVFIELRIASKLISPGDRDNLPSVLNRMKIRDNLAPSAVDIELTFENNARVIFAFNNVEGEPPYIIDIFVTDGSSIFDSIGSRKTSSRYRRLAKISDPDGYTNVRDGKGIDCPVKFKLVKEDVFFVYPNYDEAWWRVETLNCREGYVSKSRISLIGDLSERDRDVLRDSANNIYSSFPCL